MYFQLISCWFLLFFTEKSQYYVILLLGSGQGKSTLGNQLLQRHPRESMSLRFLTADDIDVGVAKSKILKMSVTNTCELQTNEKTMVRVLDTPRFFDMSNTTVYETNLQILRWICRWVEQQDSHDKMKVRRVIYFLPNRGVLEKPSGILQEELRAMYHFFGANIFNCMVVIATNHRRFQTVRFSEEDLRETRATLGLAIKMATHSKVMDVPPVVYVGLHDSGDHILSIIKGARVLKDDVFIVPKFLDNVCSKCCALVRYADGPPEKRDIVGIINPKNGSLEPYSNSTCHPCFVPRYSTAKKVIGGFAHVATVGVGLMVEKVAGVDTWPSFTNTDEICPNCKCPPGSGGCCLVMTTVEIQGKDYLVNHTF